jgi:DNA-binding Lrp family transcriptional regulator
LAGPRSRHSNALNALKICIINADLRYLAAARNWAPLMIDLLDFRILASLQNDSRAPQKIIAKGLDISEPSLSKKISKLYDDRVIRRQTVEIDLAKVGLTISALTLLKDKKQSDMAMTQELLCSFPEAYQIHKVTGEWDYAILWNCADPEHLDTVLSKVVEHSNVEKIQTLLFMRTLKRENCASLQSLLDQGRLSNFISGVGKK